ENQEPMQAALPLRGPWYTQLAALWQEMRPRQWPKNLLVFAGLVFAQRVLDWVALGRALGALVVFCLLSSVVYLINDLKDVESDRQHPTKRFRPLAAGTLTRGVAVAGALGLGALAAGLIALLTLLPVASGAAESIHLSLLPPRLTLDALPTQAPED